MEPRSGLIADAICRIEEHLDEGAALSRALECLSAAAGCDWAALWGVDADMAKLVCRGLWSSDPGAAAALLERTGRERLALGQDLPGQAWALGRPLWVEDLASDVARPRARVASGCGFRSCLCLPLGAESGIAGVLELWSAATGVFRADVESALLEAAPQLAGLLELQDSRAAERRRGDELLNLLSEHPLPLLVADANSGRIVAASRAAERAYGYQPGELLGLPLTKLEVPGADSLWSRLPSPGTVPGSQALGPARHRRRDGTPLQTELTWAGVEFGGRPAHLLVAADVSEHRRREHALLRSEELFRSSARLHSEILDSLPAQVLVLDSRGLVLAANRAWRDFAALSGHQPASWVGLNYLQVVDPLGPSANSESHEILRSLRRVLQGTPANVHWEHAVESSGGIRWFRLVIAPFVADGSGGAVVARIDITDRKAVEDAFREAHSENERLLEAISAMLIGLDRNLVVRRWNRAAHEFTGCVSEAIVGRPLAELPLAWDTRKVLEAARECLESGETSRLHPIHLTHPDGRNRVLSCALSPLLEESDQSGGVLFLATDVTEREFLEAQLSQAQKLESIGQLAAGIAHEINTPTQYVGDNVRFVRESFRQIQAVLGAYHALLHHCEREGLAAESVRHLKSQLAGLDLEYLEKEVPEALEQSMDGLERVSRIVRAMKEFSYPGNAEKVDADLNRAIESTLTVARNEWKYCADMVTHLDPELPPVPCLLGDLNQVILNLIMNAAQAIQEKLGTNPTVKGTITVSTQRDGDFAEIRISDTGCGIPEAVRHKVFEPFFTTKKLGKGTGQGLAISHLVVVRKHGGTIAFESQPGEGTTFSIRLPLNRSVSELRADEAEEAA